MPEMSPQNAALLDNDQGNHDMIDPFAELNPGTDDEVVQEKIKILGDTIAKLVDEKHDLKVELATVRLANERLAGELKACIAEKGELQKQLAAKSGLGVQESGPGFHELYQELVARTKTE